MEREFVIKTDYLTEKNSEIVEIGSSGHVCGISRRSY